MHEEDSMDTEGGLSGKTEDDEDLVMDTGLDPEVPMSEVNDNYLNASFMLPKVNRYARGKVIGRKRDADRNAVGRGNGNPILGTR